jgi:RNA polymerase sigma factor (sigma-70 family)
MEHGRQDLIIRAQSGDAQALDQLLSACQIDARRYARRHCAMSEVDDAVQEALFTVSRHLGALRQTAAFTGWLFTVVRRECARLSRKMFGLTSLDDERIEETLLAWPDHDLRCELIRALESLPPHFLEVLLLRDFEELTIAEICQRLDITVAAAKSRLNRARHFMREYLTHTDRSTGAPAR